MKRWFFDLEETVIDNWFSAQIINQSVVSSFIEQNNITHITIFSAAVFNPVDKFYFNSKIKKPLEGAFGVTVADCVSMMDVWKQSSLKNILFDSVTECLIIMGKKRMFEEWCRKYNNVHCVLLDDSFDDEVINNKTHNRITEFVNVNNLRFDNEKES